jgi:potassium efflux system protein
MQAFAEHEAQASLDDFKADKYAIVQKKALEDLKKTIQKAKMYLKQGIDTRRSCYRVKKYRAKF